MFCKYCGSSVSEQGEFCSACGRKIKSTESNENRNKNKNENETAQPISTPLAVMLIMLCWSTVFMWGRVLLFGDSVDIGTLVSTLMLAAGLALMGTLVSRKQIDVQAYRFTDILALCCVWMVVPGILWRLKAYVAVQYGYIVFEGWSVWESVIRSAIQFPVLWVLLGVIVLGLTRSGDWQADRKHSMILTAVLIVCSAAGFLFAPAIAASAGVHEESMAATVRMTRLWAVLSWLWPIAVLKVFRALGENKTGIGGAIAALLGMQLGEALLLFLLVPVFRMEIAGFALASGLAPLFSLFILKTGYSLHKETRV